MGEKDVIKKEKVGIPRESGIPKVSNVRRLSFDSIIEPLKAHYSRHVQFLLKQYPVAVHSI